MLNCVKLSEIANTLPKLNQGKKKRIGKAVSVQKEIEAEKRQIANNNQNDGTARIAAKRKTIYEIFLDFFFAELK